MQSQEQNTNKEVLMDAVEKLEEGTLITATTEAGTILGEVVGIASELGPFGFTYIIKIHHRGGIVWETYPYSCVVLPRSMFQLQGTQPWREAKEASESLRPVPCSKCGFPVFPEIDKKGPLPECEHCGYQDPHK
jgi:hypothetical protein